MIRVSYSLVLGVCLLIMVTAKLDAKGPTKKGYDLIFSKSIRIEDNVFLYKKDSFSDFINLKFADIEKEIKENFLPVVHTMRKDFVSENYKGIYALFLDWDFEQIISENYAKRNGNVSKKDIYAAWAQDVKNCSEKSFVKFCKMFQNRQKFLDGKVDILIIPNYIKDGEGHIIPEFMLYFFDRDSLNSYASYTEMYKINGKYTFTLTNEARLKMDQYFDSILWDERYNP
ncbi:hypothetical protein EHO59_12815 [Leptospira semungkisensis]|uniref:Uncharacterized protein n=1 Tax=Leptospira semungkisensis TaxID=2484985 RepID=A0A4V3JB65_9LEPT|nr:hypothetical protein [Leptospira semungkisensis]TGK00809.1 hypothetical protein EHO59_12815 [Leptospira semungkisensis]